MMGVANNGLYRSFEIIDNIFEIERKRERERESFHSRKKTSDLSLEKHQHINQLTMSTLSDVYKRYSK